MDFLHLFIYSQIVNLVDLPTNIIVIGLPIDKFFQQKNVLYCIV